MQEFTVNQALKYLEGNPGVHIVKDTAFKTHAYDTSNNQILEVKPYETPCILCLQYG